MPKANQPSLREQLKTLEALLAYFDQEDFELEAGTEKYAEAVALIRQLSAQIKDVELTIDNKRQELDALLEN